MARVPGAVGRGVARRYRTPLGEGPPGTRIAALFQRVVAAGEVGETAPDDEGAAAGWLRAARAAEKGLVEAEREIARGARVGARLIDVEDAEYPALLREIADPPAALFVLGRIEARDARAVAVIGSRSATRYGHTVTRRLVPGLVSRGVTVVAGMARGIDSAAHQAALDSGGRTIAVLGTGIDVCYPKQARRLYREIPSRGAVLSEAAPGTEAAAWLFPERNRIIAGLCAATVVVEARRRSGTSVTARLAGEQGRQVGAVPGDVDLDRSAGTNELLSQGAAPVRTAADVLALAFGEVAAAIPAADGRAPGEPGTAEVGDRRAGMAANGEGSTAGRLLALLRDEPQSVDAIAARATLPIGGLLASLSALEGAGLATRDAWGRYARA